MKKELLVFGVCMSAAVVFAAVAGGLYFAYQAGKSQGTQHSEIVHTSETVYIPESVNPVESGEPTQESAPIPSGPDYAYTLATDDVMMIADHGRAYVDEVRALWDKAAVWYSLKNTESQLYDAVERICEARQYYPELTRKHALEYLISYLPEEVTVGTLEYNEVAIGMGQSRTEGDGYTHEASAVVAAGAQARLDTVTAKIPNVRTVADEIYTGLEQLYWEPHLQAQEAEEARQAAAAELIARNAAEARERGAAKNRAIVEIHERGAAAEMEAQRQNAEWSENNRRRFYSTR